MWLRDSTVVSLDTHRVAVAVYRSRLGKRQLLAFEERALERGSMPQDPYRELCAASKDVCVDLIRALRAPVSSLSILLPVGAFFPTLVDLGVPSPGVSSDDLLRFRVASSLPFSSHEAEIRSDSQVATGSGALYAEALPGYQVEAAERLSRDLGCARPELLSALGAALRVIGQTPGGSDVILGDSAYATAERDESGRLSDVTLRLLGQSTDRYTRAVSVTRAFQSNGERPLRLVGPGAAELAQASSSRTEAVRPSLALSGRALVFPFLELVPAQS